MGIRTGQEFLDKINAMRPHVVIDGKVVTDRVADHPAFANLARSYARLYDLQHDPAHAAALTYPSPTTGDPVSASFLIPRTSADLVHRRGAARTWAEWSHGFLGRTADYLNGALTALAAAREWFDAAGPEYGERIQAYYSYVREHDLLTTHTLIPPQSNRSVSGSEQMGGKVAAQVVEERSDGIVVRGARMLATVAPIADEILVFPSTLLKGTARDVPYSFAFAVPNDTPGLRYLCRSSLHHGGSAFDEPLASRFEEMDAMVIFDDVFVPKERVFLLGNPELCNAFYSETGATALMTHQVVVRTVAKTEFYLGLASEIAAGIAIDGYQHIQEDLAELIIDVEIGKALLRAAEADAEPNRWGMMMPKWSALNAARNWYPRVSQRLPQIIRKFCASGLLAAPSEADLSSPARDDIDRYLQAKLLPAEDRARLFRLAFDASMSAFASRQAQYEYYFFGDPVRMAGALVTSYDREPARAKVREFLARTDAP